MKSQWLFGKHADLLILFTPVWVCWLISFLLPERLLIADVPLWVWVTVVIGIDVSHVWSSIHRTYFDREEFRNHRNLFIAAPIISFAVSFGLAFISIDLFWRCLAYVAVYHFVKQQFGFMRIYKAKAQDFRPKKISDNFVIYLSMLYPIVYWHMQPDLEFAWFVSGDFILIPSPVDQMLFKQVGNGMYFGLLAGWLVEEIIITKKGNNSFPAGKTLWVLTTAGNWFLGIVYFNSDLVFTITNVVAHGVPYQALIVFYQTKKQAIRTSKKAGRSFLKTGATIVSTVLLLALFEEYLWDLMVYRDNEAFFGSMIPYPDEMPSVILQLFAIAVLAVPQITHYILDGFIWKNNEKNPYLKKILLQ